jgi:type VI secretion system protein VasJ
VLGSVSSANDWQWAAYGKHPVAKDYVSLFESLPLVRTFSTWIDKGYQLLRPEDNPALRYRSWRFWAGGGRGDMLACGLLRDSRDGVGRPYPFLILGSGSLNHWNEHWDLLPFACEKAWGQMEKASVQTYDALRNLEDEIRWIRPPYPQWSEFSKEQEGLWEAYEASGSRGFPEIMATITEQVRSMESASDLYVSLHQWSAFDPFVLISCWHTLMKTHHKGMPNVVFMGGRPDSVCLAVFKRPLIPNDFARLWSGE